MQDQSSTSSAEDLFPPTTSVHQKEKITELVQSLSKDFSLYKQQEQRNGGIGGARNNAKRAHHVMGGNDYEREYRRADSTQNSHDTTME